MRVLLNSFDYFKTVIYNPLSLIFHKNAENMCHRPLKPMKFSEKL